MSFGLYEWNSVRTMDREQQINLERAAMRRWDRLLDALSVLFIAALLNVPAGELTFVRLNVPEINNMTSNMTSLEPAMSPELN